MTVPRRRLVAGNWKMAKTNDQAAHLVRALLKELLPAPGTDVVLCPPFTALTEVSYLLAGTPLRLGAQDVFWEREGPWTGEVSAPMLASAGCSHVVVGHSERRQHFGERDEHVAKKARAVIDAGLTAIVCLGETLDEREAGRTLEVLARQFDAGPGTLLASDLPRLVLAYEPVWAIGTGKVATPEDAQEVCGAIRSRLRELYDAAVADRVRILYGGSVNAKNVGELMAQPDVDGGLVGGASLDADGFAALCKNAA